MWEKYKYLTKNTLIFAISSFGTKFLSFLLVPLYTNILSTSEYGIADIITTTATLMIYIFTINISDSVLRFAIEKKENQDEILSYGIRVLILGSLILAFALGITSQLHFLNWNLYYYIFIFLYFFCTAIYQIMTNYLRAVDKIVEVAIAGIVSTVVMISGNIVFLVVIKLGIIGYLISMVMGPLAATIYCFVKVRLPLTVYLKNSCEKTTQKLMLRYCVPLIFNNIALWINAFLDKYFIVAMCGADQNGIYSVSNKIPTILSTCYMVFSQAWNLSVIKEFDGDDKDNFFSNTYGIYNAAIVVVCSGLILFNIPIARILFAKDFFEAWKYSSILLISVMFNALTSFLGVFFTAAKNSKLIATTTLISAGTNAVLNIILIPFFGVQGAAVATAISYCEMWIVRLVAAKKYVKLNINVLRDIFVYLMIFLQVILEHTEEHCYIGQILIFIFIIIIYRKYALTIFGQMKQKILMRGR